MKRALLFLLAGWYVLSAVLSRPFLPYPHTVFLHFFTLLISSTLVVHTLVSLFRITSALLLAAVPAFILGCIAGRIEKVDRFFTPFAYLLYPIPKVALLPLVMLFFGLGDFSKIFLIALIIFFQLFFVVRDASHAIDGRYLDSLRSMGADKGQILQHVIIPATLPSFFTALRVSTGTSTAVLFLAETFATSSGLGWFIMDSWARMNYLDMYGGMIALSVLATAFFVLFTYCERWWCAWMQVTR